MFDKSRAIEFVCWESALAFSELSSVVPVLVNDQFYFPISISDS